MTAVLLIAAAVVIAGAVAVVAARSMAFVAIGTAVVLAGTALLADPIPSPVVLVERAVGGALAGELLWLGLRGRPARGTSALPWPAVALLAAAAFGCGLAMHQAMAGNGPAEAMGVAVALFTVAVMTAAGRADGVAYGLAAILLVAGTSLVRTALAGPVSALETVIVALLGVAVAGVVTLLAVPQGAATAAARPMAALAGHGPDAGLAPSRRSAGLTRTGTADTSDAADVPDASAGAPDVADAPVIVTTAVVRRRVRPEVPPLPAESADAGAPSQPTLFDLDGSAAEADAAGAEPPAGHG